CAEIETERMSREDVANELVREVSPLSPLELATFEYISKISVLLDKFCALYLKISLGEFCLKKYIPELHINFGPLCCIAEQRDARHEPKFREAPSFDPQDSANLYSPRHAGVAEDVHQQRV